MTQVKIDQVGRVARLTMADAKKRNALSTEMMTALRTTLADAVNDSAVHVIVLAAEGPAFSAGHDLKELRAGQGGAANAPNDPLAAVFDLCNSLMLDIASAPKPVIAEVNGLATAAGCQLVAQCDLAVASETSRFATPGSNVGLFCSTPSVPLTRAVGQKAAMEMLLTADPINAARAYEIGLLNHVVPEDAVTETTMQLAARIAEHPPAVLAHGKRTVRAHSTLPLADAYKIAGQAMLDNLAFDDAIEGIAAFTEKRAPNWKEQA